MKAKLLSVWVSIGLSFLLLITPFALQAHSFGRSYNLPVPIWLYLYGAAAALILSFVVIGYFVTVGREIDRSESIVRKSKIITITGAYGGFLLKSFGFISLLLFCFCIYTGIAGTQNDYKNFNMTFFWIIFVLGFTYFTGLFGNWYPYINPWQVMTATINIFFKRFSCGKFTYPKRLAYWPATMAYMAFIWIELLGNTGPLVLSKLLLVYTAINLLGIALVGARDWFRYCEFFSVFLRLVGLMSFIEPKKSPESAMAEEGGRSADKGLTIQLRKPFSGLLSNRATHVTLLIFILFMLSSTAFDGLRETVFWRKLFWVDFYHMGLKDWAGRNPLAAYPVMTRLFYYWNGLCLIMSPLLYLAIYWLFIWLVKIAGRSQRSTHQLALDFAYSLLPIALVYNITHYYTLIEIQGVKIVALISDPLGNGWNLFGTADWVKLAIIPNAELVWHIQVILIVLGHIISVYIAHWIALRTFATHKQAVMSQIPMLVLMVIFTTVGLWILSQPIQPGG